MEKIIDINGVEIKTGQTVTYSSYTPNEKTVTAIVRKSLKYGGLWAGVVPITSLLDNIPYRKLTVINIL